MSSAFAEALQRILAPDSYLAWEGDEDDHVEFATHSHELAAIKYADYIDGRNDRLLAREDGTIEVHVRKEGEQEIKKFICSCDIVYRYQARLA